MFNRFTLAWVAAIALIVPSVASSATIVVNHVLDPAHVGPFIPEDLALPFSAQVGDTVDLNISFTGGQAVSMTSDTYLWPLIFTSTSGTLQTTGTLEFLGGSGPLVSGPISITQGNALVHLGNLFGSGFYRTGSGAITFSGLRQVINITSDNIGIPRTYSRLAVLSDGVTTIIDGPVSAIPESATWAMMISGFAMAGATLRRRKAQVRATCA